MRYVRQDSLLTVYYPPAEQVERPLTGCLLKLPELVIRKCVLPR